MNDEQMNQNRPYNYVPRKQSSGKYADNQNYSPSVSYNYAHSGQQNRNQNQNFQQPMNRRYKNHSVNYYERIVKQNDMIIRLLKEIKDRIPEPQSVVTQKSNPEFLLQEENHDIVQVDHDLDEEDNDLAEGNLANANVNQSGQHYTEDTSNK